MGKSLPSTNNKPKICYFLLEDTNDDQSCLAKLVMDEMDAIWLPIIKTWRLNERMYGALTGQSKSMGEFSEVTLRFVGRYIFNQSINPIP